MLKRICVALALLVAPAVSAQEAYPARPVRIVVAFPAGGSVDIVARLVGAELARRLGQPFVVDNRSGAGGNVGTDFVAKAQPDGYTLLMAGAGPIVTSPALNPELPYNPQRDLAPVTLIALQANVLIVHPSVPATSVAEFIALARAQPGRINYATAGIGSSQHLAAEGFALRTGISMTHIPYRGGAPGLSDLIAGQVQAMFETIPTALQAVRGGQVRALGVTTLNRSPAMPELATVAESGVPGYEARAWLGLLGPAALPPAIVATLDREVRAIVAGPAITARLVDLGLEITPSTPASFRAFLDAELAANRALVAAANITLN
ncbi:Bug family tripartite tricarboxylate transporter substrate binding protein [Plastoroseomonas arctica]|uniref:Tripartite tricarboxylate transporter substrate binding protein n=1 Tax=Plastoroseomonas arctica TaxID=1509237 RepID=A0AAF1JXX6_9PROT|nr:tripartite tricarboxylate transporter substrate binding protein [Plastoroseomonas arctica]MBR0654578.1 tripartite tricarboxylate transporter substrate binding protein [Plastoroseomonas arctica]